MKKEMQKIRGKVVLIGQNPEGDCVYSEILDWSDYYEGLHVWDDDESIRKLRLQKLRGFIFNDDGVLDQEVESIFDLDTGIYKTGFARFADGTVQNH